MPALFDYSQKIPPIPSTRLTAPIYCSPRAVAPTARNWAWTPPVCNATHAAISLPTIACAPARVTSTPAATSPAAISSRTSPNTMRVSFCAMLCSACRRRSSGASFPGAPTATPRWRAPACRNARRGNEASSTRSTPSRFTASTAPTPTARRWATPRFSPIARADYWARRWSGRTPASGYTSTCSRSRTICTRATSPRPCTSIPRSRRSIAARPMNARRHGSRPRRKNGTKGYSGCVEDRHDEPARTASPDEMHMISNPDVWLDLHGDALFRYALLRLRDSMLAEDLVQESLLAAMQARARYSGASSERTWLIGILKHKIVDHLRKAHRETPAGDELADHLDGLIDEHGHWRIDIAPWREPDRAFEQREFWRIFADCIEHLPRRLADALLLREIDGLDCEAICKELGIVTTNNLWVILSRARLRLRQCLDAHWFQRDTVEQRLWRRVMLL